MRTSDGNQVGPGVGAKLGSAVDGVAADDVAVDCATVRAASSLLLAVDAGRGCYVFNTDNDPLHLLPHAGKKVCTGGVATGGSAGKHLRRQRRIEIGESRLGGLAPGASFEAPVRWGGIARGRGVVAGQ
jgi:hypothetical protein